MMVILIIAYEEGVLQRCLEFRDTTKYVTVAVAMVIMVTQLEQFHKPQIRRQQLL